MVVLRRKIGQRIVVIDGERRITVTLVRGTGDASIIGIEAPPEMLILREELIGRDAASDGKSSGNPDGNPKRKARAA